MSSTTKLTKRQQKAIAFRTNRGKKVKLIADNDEKKDFIEIDRLLEKSKKREYIKEEVELKEVEKKKHKIKGFENHNEYQDTDEYVDVNKKFHGIEEILSLDENAKSIKGQNCVEENITSRIAQDNQEKSEPNNVKLKKKSPRFIIFVANLPYNTKGEELSKHFESAGVPLSIRLITDKKTKKQKGFAFIEFDNSQSMKKALIFHHTIFKKRRIRVELTVGGGGNKSEIRRKKLEIKKKQLKDERHKFHKTYIAPAKSKCPQVVDQNESAQMLKATSQPDRKVQTKIKKPKLKGSNAIKLNNVRAFG
ncbi:9365_t:CDS:2 [Cetraspora pellucida]|uniref:9365_t:CDS:1 n=1 Tax=Cetraspora pellucida TaxID=1433469 RepID=A0ACA9N6V7_9GLOM|nr:9365_t:CDS:2 [Cetraspora pellucida]